MTTQCSVEQVDGRTIKGHWRRETVSDVHSSDLIFYLRGFSFRHPSLLGLREGYGGGVLSFESPKLGLERGDSI